ncbi:MAG: VCBS repeat-containing protein, partial [Candidatus Delongbacteria bacterium]|nr:VCBS repeat-containing protein [Candidatus Delongbacteria bacterium]
MKKVILSLFFIMISILYSQKFFEEVSCNFDDVKGSSVDWGDYDNDGDQDILLAGIDASSNIISKVYRNDGNGIFTDIEAGLEGVYWGSVEWGDYDNDGDLDLILTGRNNEPNSVSKIYRNDGNDIFTDIEAGLEGVERSTSVWGDYDNDDDLDFFISGGSDVLSISIARIYRNDGNDIFTDIEAVLGGVSSGSADWGDYDND